MPDRIVFAEKMLPVAERPLAAEGGELNHLPFERVLHQGFEGNELQHGLVCGCVAASTIGGATLCCSGQYRLQPYWDNDARKGV